MVIFSLIQLQADFTEPQMGNQAIIRSDHQMPLVINILCIGGWIVGPEMAIEMVKAFLETEWCQDLEDWRKENMKKFAVQVSAIEDKIYG